MKDMKEKSMGDDRGEEKEVKRKSTIGDRYSHNDGTDAVKKPWSDADFDGGDELEEGETGYTGGGSNEKHS